jgi:hypothetical protein
MGCKAAGMPSDPDLDGRLTQLLKTANIKVWPLPGIANAISSYKPTDPARIFFLQTMTAHEKTIALAHELTHAVLHPPGADDYNEKKYMEVEEPSAHEAAAIVCETFGVTDYLTVMRTFPIPAACFAAGDPEMVQVMVERATAGLAAPGVAPRWATRVDKLRWLWATHAAEMLTSVVPAMPGRPRTADLVWALYRWLDGVSASWTDTTQQVAEAASEERAPIS